MSYTIAVIPVRGGSKRVPRKNTRPFAGAPLLSYPIRACQAAGCFDAVIVTTEDDELYALAGSLGAIVRARPASLADDHTPLAPVVRDVLDEMLFPGGVLSGPRDVCVVLANPFVRADDILAARALLDDAAGVASVARLPVPMARVLRDQGDGRLVMVAREAQRTQDLPTAFYDAGQFYWHRAASILRRPNVGLLVGALPYVLPRERVCDLDTEDDWRAAEILYRSMHP